MFIGRIVAEGIKKVAIMNLPTSTAFRLTIHGSAI